MVSSIGQWTLDALPTRRAPAPTPTVWLQTGAGPKTGKNRNHSDLTTDHGDTEVQRLLGLGARRADVGQTGDEPFVVLADPEGNEFCVLRNRPRAL